MSTVFQGGWYHTGSTILDLGDAATNAGWRATFPAGGNPIALLDTLYVPLTESDIIRLVDDAKLAYDWPAIVNQVAAIPAAYLDQVP